MRVAQRRLGAREALVAGQASHGDAPALLEGRNDRGSKLKRSASVPGVDRRLGPGAQCGQHLIDVPVEGVGEGAGLVIEVSGLPDLAGFLAQSGVGVAGDGVLDQDPAGGAVDLHDLRAGVGVGRVVGAHKAPHRPVLELQSDSQRRVGGSPPKRQMAKTMSPSSPA